MSTPESKPVPKRMLNRTLLPIAAGILILLALLFMATPLLRQTRRFQGVGNLGTPGNGPTFQQNGVPGQGSATPGPGFSIQGSGPQGFSDQGGGRQFFTDQGGPNSTNRQFIAGIGFLSGRSGPIIYFVALVIALAAAVGMFLVKRWGQVLGIFMAILYLLAGLVSLLPLLLFSAFALRNPFTLILGILHVVLAIAVIVLALIPARKETAPVAVEPPPAAA